MLFGMFLMFLLLTAGGGALMWLTWRRMAGHLKGNEEAVSALTKHLFVPLLGGQDTPQPDETPAPKPEPE
jgi:hypothetical protein